MDGRRTGIFIPGSTPNSHIRFEDNDSGTSESVRIPKRERNDEQNEQSDESEVRPRKSHESKRMRTSFVRQDYNEDRERSPEIGLNGIIEQSTVLLSFDKNTSTQREPQEQSASTFSSPDTLNSAISALENPFNQAVLSLSSSQSSSPPIPPSMPILVNSESDLSHSTFETHSYAATSHSQILEDERDPYMPKGGGKTASSARNQTTCEDKDGKGQKCSTFTTQRSSFHDEIQSLQSRIKSQEKTIERLKTTRDRLKNEVKELSSQNSPRQALTTTSSLDIFDQSLDQVSELHIRSDGQPSLDGINAAIDSLISNTMESVEVISEGVVAANEPHTRRQSDNLILRALSHPNMTFDQRGLLVESLLHDLIVTSIHSHVFQGHGTPFTDPATEALNSILEDIDSKEPWHTAQRWRAVTASSVHRLVKPSVWQIPVGDITKDIIHHLETAYQIPASSVSHMSANIEKSLLQIFSDSFELSVIIKRDVLSVRMHVMMYKDDSYQDFMAEDIYPDMGARNGDKILGQYNFGLLRQTHDGNVEYIVKPKVTTAALLREIIRNPG